MAAHTNKLESKKNLKNKKDETVEVLYQKLGDRWYAFSLIDDEVFVGSINPSEIDPNVAEINN